ncbi:hypothetical protein [Silvibacterium sp.]|uniref:hypothetical protein n=1 Tax=Silvibacterium sp. TaxID=1964179 RepID=UPI0039E57C82
MAEPLQPASFNERYPTSPSGRDRWIVEHRGAVLNDDGIPIAEHRAALSPWEPYGYFLEEEPAANGRVAECVTILLTNRECPWRCAMCDLWRNTLTATVPTGAIPAQIDYALSRLLRPGENPGAPRLASETWESSQSSREARGDPFKPEVGLSGEHRIQGVTPATPYTPNPTPSQIKLYNAGSFFDPRAIPSEDDEAIAARLRHFDRVIVECHPALLGDRIGDRCLRFRSLIPGRLEVAMGLETVHPEALEKLNKRMTLASFRASADWLRENDIDLRAFILVQPPFVPASEALHWTCRSLDFAFDCGATAVSLLATRGGNGAMESLAAGGHFLPPSLASVEAAFDYGLSLQRGRVFTDTWDVPKSAACDGCSEARIARLKAMNLSQQIQPRIACEHCNTIAP